MTEGLISYLNALFFPVELISAAAVFSLPLERRRGIYWRAAAYIGALLLLSLLPVLAEVQYDALSGAVPEAVLVGIVFCAFFFFLGAGFIAFTRAVSLREAVYCAACAYLMEHMAYCVRLLIENYLPNLNAEPGSAFYFLVHAVTYAVFYLVFARRMVKNRHYGTTVLSSLRLTVTVLAVVLILSLLASSYGFEGIHAVYAIIFGLFVLYAQIDHQRELNLQTELDFQRELTAQQKAQYEMSRENIELINRKCHDLKHQIAALKHIRDEKKQDEVISSLEDSVMIYDSIMKTGNDILDTVLTEKSLACQHNGITLSCIADGALLGFMDPVDAYTLFGNALDNAIEAVIKLPRERRLIDFTVREMVGMTIVKLVNNYSGELVYSGGLPKTSKGDENYHGFGVKSIKSIAEKYDGIVKISAENGRFTLQITFPPEN